MQPDHPASSVAFTRDTTRSEQVWEIVAGDHKDRQEWRAARLASDVADAIRYYRVHLEALDAAGRPLADDDPNEGLEEEFNNAIRL